jgi:hypothetical protein
MYYTILQWLDPVTSDKFTVTYRKLDNNPHWMKAKDGRYFQKGFPDKKFDAIYVGVDNVTRAKHLKMTTEDNHKLIGYSKVPVDVKK